MASSAAAGGDMKGFYRQRKQSSGVTKTSTRGKLSSTTSSWKKSSSPNPSATLGSDSAQPAALISHSSLDLRDDCDENEEVLRQFDVNMAYGPCLGMSRLARWERANSLGMNPPKDVERLLKAGKFSSECLWDGRV